MRRRLDPGARRRFHVMVKAAGPAGNLDCTYCFYSSQ
jgi:sulfatase maturation enzyme AslB (radical SAM superfamily)